MKTGDIFWQHYLFMKLSIFLLFKGANTCGTMQGSRPLYKNLILERCHFYQIKASKSFLGCSIIKMNVVSNDISFLHFCRRKYWNNGLDTLCYAPLPKTLLTAFPLISWIKIVFFFFNVRENSISYFLAFNQILFLKGFELQKTLQ